jgi:hypothetical protein
MPARCGRGGTGRRRRLKISCPSGRAGSSPAVRTITIKPLAVQFLDIMTDKLPLAVTANNWMSKLSPLPRRRSCSPVALLL